MSEGPAPASKPLGFWSSWSLTVGIMIGSGIFLLPAVLAPYGLISFAGWVLTGTGYLCSLWWWYSSRLCWRWPDHDLAL